MQTNIPIRIHFNNGIDVFSTPSSTPKTPASWPPRPDSTVLRQTWVAGYVVFFALPDVRPFTQPIPTPSIRRSQPICDVFRGDIAASLAFHARRRCVWRIEANTFYILGQSFYILKWSFYILKWNFYVLKQSFYILKLSVKAYLGTVRAEPWSPKETVTAARRAS